MREYRVVWKHRKQPKDIKNTVWFDHEDKADRMAECLRLGGAEIITVEVKHDVQQKKHIR